ncbi:MAG: squalene/phytoene synthase family protein [Chloroflexota bacterium]
MTELTELRSADRFCRYLADRHYENFSVYSHFLSEELRTHLARIYAYCRTTDDLGDESGEAGLARLAVWRMEVEALFSGSRPIHPVLIALDETIRQFEMPAQPFLSLISANEQDQSVKSYVNWEALHAYCCLSAAPVGRMVLRVFGMTGRREEMLSDDVCIGLQLVNFAQDVARDRAKGRTYLIQAEIDATDPGKAVKRMCDRAATLLEAGRDLEPMAPGRLSIQLALYRLGGLAVIDAVRAAGYRTDLTRPHLGAATKAALLLKAATETTRRNGHARHRLA